MIIYWMMRDFGKNDYNGKFETPNSVTMCMYNCSQYQNILLLLLYSFLNFIKIIRK